MHKPYLNRAARIERSNDYASHALTCFLVVMAAVLIGAAAGPVISGATAVLVAVCIVAALIAAGGVAACLAVSLYYANAR